MMSELDERKAEGKGGREKGEKGWSNRKAKGKSERQSYLIWTYGVKDGECRRTQVQARGPAILSAAAPTDCMSFLFVPTLRPW